jgi:hypothetical protein
MSTPSRRTRSKPQLPDETVSDPITYKIDRKLLLELTGKMQGATTSSWHLMLTLLLCGLVAADLVARVPPGLHSYGGSVVREQSVHGRATVPAQAQVIDQKTFNVLPQVQPSYELNATTVRSSRDKRGAEATDGC